MIFGINTTCDIAKLSQITYNNFETSLMVFMPNITTNHAITYTNIYIYFVLGKWRLRTAEEIYLVGNKMMLFGFALKYYVRVMRVCSNCDKTTSQSQSKTERKCNFHN